MAKKAKRRVWTKEDVRELKALAKSRPSYEVIGKRDGVSILRPKARPTHFTSKEIRKAIAQSDY